MGEAWAWGRLLEGVSSDRCRAQQLCSVHLCLYMSGQGFYEKMGWSASADPRKRQFEVKKGENEALKREIVDIENKRVQEHRDITSDVSKVMQFLY